MRPILRWTAISALLVSLAVLALAQTTPSKPAPAVPDAVKAHYFKTTAQIMQAQQQLQAAQQAVTQHNTELQAVIAEINKACGAKFHAQLSKDGDPECVATPEKPAEPAKK